MISAPLPNLTNAELLRMTGTLPVARIEALIDSEAHFEQVDGVAPCIMEAKGCYPDEGFLYPVIERLQALAKSTRGENRQEVQSIIVALEQIDYDATNEAEYGRDELKKALKCIEEKA